MERVVSSKKAPLKATKKPLVVNIPKLSEQESAAEEMMQIHSLANPDSYGLVMERILYGTDHRVDAIVFRQDGKPVFTDCDDLDEENADYREIEGYARSSGVAYEDDLRGIDWDEFADRIPSSHDDPDWDLDDDVTDSLRYVEGDEEEDQDEDSAQLSDAA